MVFVFTYCAGIVTDFTRNCKRSLFLFRAFRTVGAKVTYKLLAPSVLQETPNGLGDDGESESGSTAPDGNLVSVAEPLATGEEASVASELPRVQGHWVVPSTSHNRPRSGHSATNRHS